MSGQCISKMVLEKDGGRAGWREREREGNWWSDNTSVSKPGCLR